jgi:hypothetical protein
LLGRCSTTWATPPSLFCFTYFSDGVLFFAQGGPQTVILFPLLPHSPAPGASQVPWGLVPSLFALQLLLLLPRTSFLAPLTPVSCPHPVPLRQARVRESSRLMDEHCLSDCPSLAQGLPSLVWEASRPLPTQWLLMEVTWFSLPVGRGESSVLSHTHEVFVSLKLTL